MTELITVFWRDIPAQVIARAGRKTARVALPQRYQEAIDQAAMRARLTGTDAYLAAWRRISEPVTEPAELETTARERAAELETAFDEQRLHDLVANYGHQPRP